MTLPPLRSRLLTALGTAIAVVTTMVIVTTPGSASAATETVNGTTSSSDWVLYPTVRTSTSAEDDIDGAANQLLNGGINLSLRLHHQSGSVWTGPTHWSFADLHTRKSFTTNVASGNPFRLAACCVTSGGLQTWGARIWY